MAEKYILHGKLNKDSIIGKEFKVKIDRPIGSRHPKHPEIIYPINYGYVEGLIAPDGEEQDVYILGIDYPIQECTGKIIAIIHRFDDVEDKWVLSIDERDYSIEEIASITYFQEQFYKSIIIK